MPRAFRPNEVSAGGVVVRFASGRAEVCLISDGSHWGFPKGIVEPGESPQEAALREISEETGIPRDAMRLRDELPTSEYVYRSRERGRLIFKRVHQYLVECRADVALQPDPAEIADAAWLDLDTARARVSFAGMRATLDAARRALAAERPTSAP